MCIQGGVLALLQRIDLVTGERLSLFDSGEEDSTGNSSSEGEDTDGISSMAEETCHFKNGGRLVIFFFCRFCT